MAMQRFREARKQLHRAQPNKEVKQADIYEALGLTEMYAGQYIEAAEWFKKASEQQSNNPIYRKEEGVALMYAGRYEEAILTFDRAISIKDDNLDSEDISVAVNLNNMAMYYFNEEQYEKAKSLFKRAFEIFKTVLGPEHLDTKRVLENYERLLEYMDEIEMPPLPASTLEPTPEPTREEQNTVLESPSPPIFIKSETD
jgi:tetratricopeptide (TPR) repeat protein